MNKDITLEIMNGNLPVLKTLVSDSLAAKISEKIEAMKPEVARSIFNQITDGDK